MQAYISGELESGNQSWPTMSCQHGWTYNLDDFFRSAVTDVSCRLDTFVQSTYATGRSDSGARVHLRLVTRNKLYFVLYASLSFNNFFSLIHSSILFQMNWVCDDQWKGSFSQSLFNVGATIGTLLFGWISDHYGRFKVRICLFIIFANLETRNARLNLIS